MGNADDEMLKALKEYRGPITRCPIGKAKGAGDLNIWALRRSQGKSGVPDAEVQRKIKKAAKKLKKKTRLHQQFRASGSHQRMSFQQWLSLKPSARRKLADTVLS